VGKSYRPAGHSMPGSRSYLAGVLRRNES